MHQAKYRPFFFSLHSEYNEVCLLEMRVHEDLNVSSMIANNVANGTQSELKSYNVLVRVL